jgi:hypothetical protein
MSGFYELHLYLNMSKTTAVVKQVLELKVKSVMKLGKKLNESQQEIVNQLLENIYLIELKKAKLVTLIDNEEVRDKVTKFCEENKLDINVSDSLN